MKTTTVFLLGLIASMSTLSGQPYSIDSFTIDGGGGTSTGGGYTVSGAIGQPDAGTLSGGNFTLQGGFWSVAAVAPTPEAPWLSIFRTSTNTVAVSWPSPSTGWTLQQNTNGMNPLSWSTVTLAVQDDGATKTLVITPRTRDQFYRLKFAP